jgi:hypothetical protein
MACRACDYHGDPGLYGIKAAFQDEDLGVGNPVGLD